MGMQRIEAVLNLTERSHRVLDLGRERKCISTRLPPNQAYQKTSWSNLMIKGRFGRGEFL